MFDAFSVNVFELKQEVIKLLVTLSALVKMHTLIVWTFKNGLFDLLES